MEFEGVLLREERLELIFGRGGNQGRLDESLKKRLWIVVRHAVPGRIAGPMYSLDLAPAQQPYCILPIVATDFAELIEHTLLFLFVPQAVPLQCCP
ncbi:MAG: hypothetical protein JRN15_21870 [Nitrososphaerota archaeon]|nr:hypothetical protein [Nitrososphaerota archaeon]